MKDNKKISIDKKNDKLEQIIIISLFIFVLIIVIFLFARLNMKKNSDYDTTRLPVSEKLSEKKVYDSLEITDIDVYKSRDSNYINYKLCNNGEDTFESKTVYLLFLDEAGKTIDKVEQQILKTDPGVCEYYHTIIDPDTTDAYEIKISDK